MLALTFHQQITSDIARIRQMDRWRYCFINERLLNCCGAFGITNIGRTYAEEGEETKRQALK
jgi:hypothetical protein